MRNKQLREELADFPDDIEVSIVLDDRGTAMESDVVVGWKGMPGGVATATAIHISDRVELDYDGPVFDGQIRLGLPDEFYTLCADAGVTPTEVLHRFIADLCDIQSADGPRDDGLASNGSDERMLAQQYFKRCGYRFIAETRDDSA